jgi:nucleotide-binding universal stress UspA family protein
MAGNVQEIAITYRSLLVLLDHSSACAARTTQAMRLAKDLDCHLVGLAPTDLIDLPTLPDAAASLNEYAALVWDALRDQAERAAETFRDACHAAGVRSFEAVIDEANKVESLVRHARCSDLTVLTQADPSAPNFYATKDLVESVVLHSARPTLVLPYAGDFEGIGKRVLVAWNDSREAARAVSDALPMLQRAAQVEVASWSEGASAKDDPLRPQLDALHKWLMWHGVSAQVRVETGRAGIADAMLSHAADTDADLIVMGAYGHSRWAELVLGGATRGLLASMTVPVLMSH